MKDFVFHRSSYLIFRSEEHMVNEDLTEAGDAQIRPDAPHHLRVNKVPTLHAYLDA